MSRFLLATVFILFAGTAFADHTYICEVSERGNTGWIPSYVIILHRDESYQAYVLDPIIRYFNDGEAVEAKVSADNEKRITFVWTVRVQDSAKQNANMHYRASWLKKERRLVLSASVPGYDSVFRGQGSCEIR